MILESISLIWAFTESNFSTFVLPNTAFGLAAALSGSLLVSGHTPSVVEIAQRLPFVLAFNWYSVFIFDLANQKSPESIKEDLINKPWRPIPTGKITADQTRRWMLVTIPVVLVLNYWLGVWKQGVFILILTYLYNDLRGSDELIRDLIIAVAYGLFNHASLQLLLDERSEIPTQATIWISIVSGAILTTMQVQDLKDQPGDRTRGRRTIPLALGETFSRWMIAICVLLWSFICAVFWGLDTLGAVPLITLGGYVAFCATQRRNVKDDTRTWKLWCLWQASLYFLPVFRSIRHL